VAEVFSIAILSMAMGIYYSLCGLCASAVRSVRKTKQIMEVL